MAQWSHEEQVAALRDEVTRLRKALADIALIYDESASSMGEKMYASKRIARAALAQGAPDA